MTEIKKVAVIGAGVMGAGIAAQVANAETEVLLLDIVPEGLKNRNAISEGALTKLIKNKPAALMHKNNAKFITTGNTEDHLKDLKDCDWIIEAVIENIDIKRDLYKKIDKYRKKGSIVSSNTSTLPLEMLTEKASKSFKEDFLITHFFNPPRYMRLIELVTSENTSKTTEARIRKFVDYGMGKSIVDCQDTPGFIANRIGTFWIHAAVTKAIKHGIGVEEADAVLGRPTGVPKTGVFGLIDLVGLDLMPHIFKSFQESLKKDDPFLQLGDAPELLGKMIADGYTGRKGKGGFYRLNEENGKKIKEVINLHNGLYSKACRPKVQAVVSSKKGGLKSLISHRSKEGAYAWDVLADTLSYAASLVGDIAGDIELIDRAMRLGYNWKYGPFELIEKIGAAHFETKLIADALPVPAYIKMAKGRKLYRTDAGKLQFLSIKGEYENVVRPEGVLLLEDIKRASSPIYQNNFTIPLMGATLGASIWDIGDGILCVEFNSKMNTFDPLIMNTINKAVDLVHAKDEYKGLVIYNEGSNFSVGANIALVRYAIKLKLWPFVRWFIRKGQKTFMKMKYSNFPVVGAPSGLALGGGCEVVLHCNAVEAHAETYTGLVEAGVGLVPAWGGCKELVGRAMVDPKEPKGPMPAPMKAFMAIATAQVATSAKEARDLNILLKTDGIVMNRDRVLAAAKARALSMVDDYKKPEPFIYTPAGCSGAASLKIGVRDFAKKGIATPYDVKIAGKLAHILTGGTGDMTQQINEEDMLSLELEGIVALTKMKKTQARVIHMITKNKPLRN
ncbi:MAG: 3-hydroxyacyl-CoA dehydrogenase [Alphaproteobacteria bacterium]|jgi:3-hydroxyacyl-CoA dehydrogenase